MLNICVGDSLHEIEASGVRLEKIQAPQSTRGTLAKLLSDEDEAFLRELQGDPVSPAGHSTPWADNPGHPRGGEAADDR